MRSDHRAPAIMIMGTGSNAGKSTIVAGLCRALTRRGLSVRPFKPQNMSNNAAATGDGGEIGRAQAMQAMAARVALSVHMNPVLLKPESDTGAQIIVQGKRFGALRARDYSGRAATLMNYVMESFAVLEREADIIVVEGAGSPAEINLRMGDIANMGFAMAAEVPVVIAGDVDRGGVIASLVGTHAVLPKTERALIRGFLINKFRGDARLFDEGLTEITARTGWPSLGVVPWLPDAAFLPAEDAVDLERRIGQKGRVKIATPMLARIANFDDLDPLSMEASVDHRFVRPGEPLPGDADLVIIPGSKATIADLAFFRAQGWDVDLAAHVRRGGHVMGLCGGYQMLGRSIADPDGIEGPPESVAGLGYLDIGTTLTGEKVTRPVTAEHLASGRRASGYEIHLGRTEGADCARPFARIEGRDDGAITSDGRIAGTYLHGLFVDDEFRRAWLSGFGAASALAYRARVEQALDALADHLEAHLDIERIIAIARQRKSSDSST